MARSLGNPYKLFITTDATAPVTPLDASDAAYNVVQQVDALSLNGEREEITATDRDGSSVLAGSSSYTIDLTANFDPASVTGQAALITAYGDGLSRHWTLSTDVTGEVAIYGQGKILNISLDLPTNAAATLSTSIGGEDDFVVGAAV